MRSILSSSRNLSAVVISNLLDYLYPFDCALCGKATNPQDALDNAWMWGIASRELCSNCNDFSKTPRPQTRRCEICGEQAIKLDRCLICQVSPPRPTLLWSASVYDGTLKELLRIYKYGKRRTLGKLLGQLLVCALREQFIELPRDGSTVVAPLPSSHESLRQRGFHHVLPLAQALSMELRVPLKLFALESIRDRAPQVSLESSARFQNVQGAFRARPRFVKGKTVILVDDVVTTGATLDAGTQTLIEAGAKSVLAISLARSPQFMHHRLEHLSQLWRKRKHQQLHDVST